MCCVFFQAEDGIRDLVRSRGLGDVYKRQVLSQSFLLIRAEENLSADLADEADYKKRNHRLHRFHRFKNSSSNLWNLCNLWFPSSSISRICPIRGWTILWQSRPTDHAQRSACLLYTSDAADERSSVDLGGRRIIKKKKSIHMSRCPRNKKI